MKNDSHSSRTSQLEMENRAIERILVRYSDCLDADDLFTCLEKLAERKTNLSIDLDKIRSRVSQSSLERREIDLEAEPDVSEELNPAPAGEDGTDEPIHEIERVELMANNSIVRLKTVLIR